MGFRLNAALLLGLMALAPARAAETACGDIVRVNVDPAARASEVAAVLKRRLAVAGDAEPSIEAKDGGLAVALPPGLPETLLTRPARIEFRIVAKPGDAGALTLPKLDGKGEESVEPEVIFSETRLRQVKVRQEPDGAALAFRLEPTAAKNLMTATAESIGRKLAIIVDDVVVAEPEIRAPVASIEGEISGGFTPQSAAEMAQLLTSGRLPARVTVASREPKPCASH